MDKLREIKPSRPFLPYAAGRDIIISAGHALSWFNSFFEKENISRKVNSMPTGFKEWKSICDTLELGKQTIILRKGGIAEGREGFLWKHKKFFLFPTAHHDHRDQLKNDFPVNDSSFAKGNDGRIEIRLHARIIWSADIGTMEIADKLAPYHIWKPEVIEQRFEYSESKGIRLALLRVSRLREPWILEDSPAFGGCRSWLELPEHELLDIEAVINDTDFSAQKNQLEQLLSEEGVKITEFDQ